MIMLSFILFYSMWSFWVESNLCKFCIVYWYLCYRLRSNYQQGKATIPTHLIPHHFCACPQPGPVCHMSWSFDWRWKVIVCFVDHRCVSILFIMVYKDNLSFHNVMSSHFLCLMIWCYCLFCWYWLLIIGSWMSDYCGYCGLMNILGD